MKKTVFRPAPGSDYSPGVIDDVTLQFLFRTDASCGFELWRPLRKTNDGEVLDRVTVRVGFLQIHYPCDGILPVRIFAALPEPYRLPQMTDLGEHSAFMATLEFKLKNLIIAVMGECRIPIDLHYRGHFHLGEKDYVVASDEFRAQYEFDGGFSYESDDEEKRP